MAQTTTPQHDTERTHEVRPVHRRPRQLPWPLNIYQSAVGKKYAMAISGIGLLGFVVVHMIGNLHLYEGPVQVHEYGEALRDLGGHLAPRTFLLWLMRLGLMAMFAIHIHSAYSLSRMSLKADDAYAGKRNYIAANFASRTMRWTGPIVLLYLLFHLADLTWGWWLGDEYVRGDIYHNVTESMSSLPVAIIYIVANIALAIHIFHGTWSMFQSLGLNNPKFNDLRRGIAGGLAAVILIGNLSFPIAVQAGLINEDNRSVPVGEFNTDTEPHNNAAAPATPGANTAAPATPGDNNAAPATPTNANAAPATPGANNDLHTNANAAPAAPGTNNEGS